MRARVVALLVSVGVTGGCGLCPGLAGAQPEAGFPVEEGIPYWDPEADGAPGDGDGERCLLDLYLPEDTDGFPTVVWFHGGGLKGGERSVPGRLVGEGVAVVAPGYRLYPAAKSPAYLEDAAAAVAWVFEHIAGHGGDAGKIVVSGHSAGGYLASMLVLDKRWLAAHGIDADRVAGVAPFSGQAVTHSTVREERGTGPLQPVVDDMAPLYHVRPDAPPVRLITGGRELELKGRYEENALLWRMLRVVGHEHAELMELDGYGHGMTEPGFPLLLEFVRQVTGGGEGDGDGQGQGE